MKYIPIIINCKYFCNDNIFNINNIPPSKDYRCVGFKNHEGMHFSKGKIIGD